MNELDLKQLQDMLQRLEQTAELLRKPLAEAGMLAQAEAPQAAEAETEAPTAESIPDPLMGTAAATEENTCPAAQEEAELPQPPETEEPAVPFYIPTLAQPVGETILSMRNIYKKYRMGEEEQTVLKGVDLDVHRGEFVAILGPSGSGKSTLMNIIGCLDVPTSGQYILHGKDVKGLNEGELAQVRSREIGFIFQSFQLLKRQDAMENVMLPLVYSGVSSRDRHARAKHMLERVGLSDKLHHYPNQLSGGQQQRVAIARALANDPTILLADEPTGALDQQTGHQVMDLFHELNNEGRTIIMITHDVSIARHASRIVRILDGELSEGVAEDA